MKKNLTDILKEVEDLGLSFSKQADAGVPPMQEVPAAAPVPQAQPVPDAAQPAVVPQGSPEEQAILAQQAQLAQAEANANMVNAAIAAEKKKEDAITNAAAALVSAEQSKEEALATLNQVAAEALSVENAAIAKEASDFGAIAGEAMASAFYDTINRNNYIDAHYNNAYSSVVDFVKEAADEEYYTLEKISMDAYDMVYDDIATQLHLVNAYNEVSNIYK